MFCFITEECPLPRYVYEIKQVFLPTQTQQRGCCYSTRIGLVETREVRRWTYIVQIYYVIINDLKKRINPFLCLDDM